MFFTIKHNEDETIYVMMNLVELHNDLNESLIKIQN